MSVISTGNILLTKKAGQKPVEELIDCLRATFAETKQLTNGTAVQIIENPEDGGRSNVKVGAKIFLNRKSAENLQWALKELYSTLKVEYLDNLILAYHPTENESLSNGTFKANEPQSTSDWGTVHDASAQSDLIALWRVLEQYALEKKINQLGVADLDAGTLENLYATAAVRPTIAQINLQACCVVPPPLQEFCNQNDVQLLTHSDPIEILNEKNLTEVAGGDNKLQPLWTIRYQVHLKCRGVLTVKGYLVGTQ